MSHIPVSAVIISDGVAIGALIIRLMALSIFSVLVSSPPLLGPMFQI